MSLLIFVLVCVGVLGLSIILWHIDLDFYAICLSIFGMAGLLCALAIWVVTICEDLGL